MNRWRGIVALAVTLVLFLVLAVGGTLVVESDVGDAFLRERNLSDAQTACVDFERHQGGDTFSCSNDERSVEISGDPGPTDGRYGRALAFDGVDDYASAGVEYGSGSFTESVWIRSVNASWGRSDVEWPGRWVTKQGTRHGGFFAVDESEESVAGYRLVDESGERVSLVSAPIETGTWIHLAVVYDADDRTLRLYKDGEFVESVALDAPPSPWSGLRFGGQGAYWFNGSLDNYRMYDSAMTDSDVEALSEGELTYYPALYSEAMDATFLAVSALLSLGAVYWGTLTDE